MWIAAAAVTPGAAAAGTTASTSLTFPAAHMPRTPVDPDASSCTGTTLPDGLAAAFVGGALANTLL